MLLTATPSSCLLITDHQCYQRCGHWGFEILYGKRVHICNFCYGSLMGVKQEHIYFVTYIFIRLSNGNGY
jgi:hypothetical protein